MIGKWSGGTVKNCSGTEDWDETGLYWDRRTTVMKQWGIVIGQWDTHGTVVHRDRTMQHYFGIVEQCDEAMDRTL